jgi:hypothetical protein
VGHFADELAPLNKFVVKGIDNSSGWNGAYETWVTVLDMVGLPHGMGADKLRKHWRRVA